MTGDLLTVMWKERKGLLRYRGSRTRFLMTLLSPVILAVWMPWDAGLDWVEGLSSILISAIVPIILVAITIPDSFAGERERHTLGTLLASRLPDRSILFGKVAVSIAFAWAVTILILILGLVVVNVVHGEGEILFYTPTVLLADLGLSFLLAALLSGAGVLISLRSETVQEATQTLTAIFLLPPMILGFLLMMFIDQAQELLSGVTGEQILLLFVAILLVANAAIYVVVLSRFQRSRLMLD